MPLDVEQTPLNLSNGQTLIASSRTITMRTSVLQSLVGGCLNLLQVAY